MPRGERPRTIAFGRNGELNILDFACMFDIVRYTRINIEARDPAEVYPAAEMDAASNTVFLEKCAARLPAINFVERESASVYARMESGRMIWVDPVVLERVLADDNARVALNAMQPRFDESVAQFSHGEATRLSDEARLHIMGRLN